MWRAHTPCSSKITRPASWASKEQDSSPKSQGLFGPHSKWWLEGCSYPRDWVGKFCNHFHTLGLQDFCSDNFCVNLIYYELKSLNHCRLECLRSESKCTPSSTFLPKFLINFLTAFTRCIDWRSKCQIHSSPSVGWTRWHCLDQAERGSCTGAGKDCAGEGDLVTL